MMNFRLSGGKGCSFRIHDATALTMNAVWVGNNDIRFFPGDLNIPFQLAWMIGIDFIQDHFGFTTGEIRVTLNPTALLGLGIFPTVI